MIKKNPIESFNKYSMQFGTQIQLTDPSIAYILVILSNFMLMTADLNLLESDM